MSNPVIGVHAPDLKGRIKDIADRMGISMSDLAKTLLEPEVERIEREWTRTQRMIDRLSDMSFEDLEEEESRLLDMRRRSRPEQAYLDAIQAELRDRTRQPVQRSQTA